MTPRARPERHGCAAPLILAQAYDPLGFDAIGVGDVDGDGADDFILSSAWAIVHKDRQGRVFLVAGPKLR